MVKLVLDQAEGLRRLVARHTTRIVAVVGSAPEAGQTSVALNLASALAHHGQDVVLADESGHAAPALGVPLRGDIHDVLAGRVAPESIRVSTRDNVALVPVAHRHPERIDPARALPLLTIGEPDVVVIDCTHAGALLSPLAAHAHDVLVVLGRGVDKVILALVLVQWGHYARIMRSRALQERRKEYVEAAANLGFPAWRIMVFHLLPNCLGPVMVFATIQIATAIALEATLSFLGVGVPITEPSLGLLISNGFQYLLSGDYWISLFPGIALLLLILSINIVGDRLRESLDPKR